MACVRGWVSASNLLVVQQTNQEAGGGESQRCTTEMPGVQIAPILCPLKTRFLCIQNMGVSGLTIEWSWDQRAGPVSDFALVCANPFQVDESKAARLARFSDRIISSGPQFWYYSGVRRKRFTFPVERIWVSCTGNRRWAESRAF